jgi:hypothetical protein
VDESIGRLKGFGERSRIDSVGNHCTASLGQLPLGAGTNQRPDAVTALDQARDKPLSQITGAAADEDVSHRRRYEAQEPAGFTR